MKNNFIFAFSQLPAAYLCAMKLYLFFIAFFVWSLSALAQDNEQIITLDRRNSPEQQEKPYIILISADGFRYDYAEKFGAAHLLSLSEKGIRAESMIPSFPSKTFPNHYSLVTGLYPSHHGLVNNRFYDPQRQQFYSTGKRNTVEDGSWYGGTPLWVLAEQQQMLTASYFWIGSEAPIKEIYPTYYFSYNETTPIEERIATVVNWLKLPAAVRPHLISFYFPEVDHAGHRFGPDAPETREAVQFVDNSIRLLTEAVATTGLPVNFIFVSDHGMTQADTLNTLPLPAAIDTAAFIINRGDVLTTLHAKDKRSIKKTFRSLKKQQKGFTPYLKTNMPAHLHYGAEDDSLNRIGDIILLADWPKIFSFSDRKPIVPGRHGYDPWQVQDMHATFYAWGPAFKTPMVIPSFENVHVYPLITRILGLPYTHPIDGNESLANELLE